MCGGRTGNISPLEVLVNYDTEDRSVVRLLTRSVARPFGSDSCVWCVWCVWCVVVFSIHIKVYDPNNLRWEIPQSVLPYPAPTSHGALNYAFSYTASPFSAAVTRLSDGEVLVNFTSLQFQDQFLTVTTPLGPAPRVYGVGEHGTACAVACCDVWCAVLR